MSTLLADMFFKVYSNLEILSSSSASNKIHCGRIVGKPSTIRSPSSTLGLDADFVIHRELNSLFATKISFSGLH